MKNQILQKVLETLDNMSTYEVSSLLKTHIFKSHQLIGDLFQILASDSAENSKEGKKLFEELLFTCYLALELADAEYPDLEEDVEGFLKDNLSHLLVNDAVLSLMMAQGNLSLLILQFYMVYTGEEDKMDEDEVFNNALDMFAALYIVCQRLGLDPKKYL